MIQCTQNLIACCSPFMWIGKSNSHFPLLSNGYVRHSFYLSKRWASLGLKTSVFSSHYTCDCLIDTTCKFTPKKKKYGQLETANHVFRFPKMTFAGYHDLYSFYCGPFKNTPSSNYAEIRNLTHFAWCHINSKWMLEREDIADSANTHLRNCFVVFLE